MDLMGEISGHDLPARKRLRTSHACDICRSRKIRCDGNTPCRACAVAAQECTYGSEANSRGKTDLVLDGVLRIERFLHELSSTIVRVTTTASSHKPVPLTAAIQTQQNSPTAQTNARHSYTSPAEPSPVASYESSSQTGRRPAAYHTAPFTDIRDANGLDNAVLDSMHTSTTESVLQWHHFDVFPSLRNDYESIFHLEHSRPTLQLAHSTPFPYLHQEDLSSILESFERNVNFWYPTVSQRQFESIHAILGAGAPADDSEQTCLALLVMALGCASQVTSNLTSAESFSAEEAKRRAARRRMGDIYFEGALKKLYVAHLTLNSTATQCLFFVALYFAFLCRPLQAWEFIGAAAGKCLTLLSNEPEAGNHEDQERTRRVFWACYILESDYVAELSACPVSGIARIESSVPLPGTYNAHASHVQEEQSSLYFLACISMRRLLNRVHQLLYARDTGAATNPARFPKIVAELQHQLDEWRDVLPPSFAFRVDTSPAANAASGFLRQRYLTCRSVIYRPYLMWLLSGKESGSISSGGGPGFSTSSPSQEVLGCCRACLDACLMHILNLRGFSHTVLVDTWICSLSMAGAMLVLLAACRVRHLRDLIGHEATSAGDHLKQLLQSWQELSGGPSSPSVAQSVRIIGAADKFIKEILNCSPDEVELATWRRIEL